MAKSRTSRSRTATIDPGSPPSATIEVDITPPSVPTYYVNNTSVETSVWDVKLRLAETIETDRERNILRVRELAIVRMSPQHARVVVGIINQHLENYEKRFGRIPAASESPPIKEEDEG